MAWLKWCLPGSSNAKLQLSPFHSLFIGNESFSPVFTQEEENLVPHPGMRSIRELVGLCYKRQSNYRHTSPRLFFFTNWWFVPPCRGQLCGCHFPQQHLLSSCLCHTLVILTIWQMYLLYICYGGSAIRDLWRYYCNCFGAPQTAPIQDSDVDC